MGTGPVAEFGPLALRSLGRTIRVEGETTSGAEGTGSAALYELTGPHGLRLTVRDARWLTGERDVVTCERHDSPPRFDTLVERLRLSVADHGESYVELRQARLRANGRAGLFVPDRGQLDAGAGCDVSATLLRHGASAVGTRAELLYDDGRHRDRYGVLFPDAAELVPVIAYALTRVAPVLHSMPA